MIISGAKLSHRQHHAAAMTFSGRQNPSVLYQKRRQDRNLTWQKAHTFCTNSDLTVLHFSVSSWCVPKRRCISRLTFDFLDSSVSSGTGTPKRAWNWISATSECHFSSFKDKCCGSGILPSLPLMLITIGPTLLQL